jgi:hypothetical protein
MYSNMHKLSFAFRHWRLQTQYRAYRAINCLCQSLTLDHLSITWILAMQKANNREDKKHLIVSFVQVHGLHDCWSNFVCCYRSAPMMVLCVYSFGQFSPTDFHISFYKTAREYELEFIFSFKRYTTPWT